MTTEEVIDGIEDLNGIGRVMPRGLVSPKTRAQALVEAKAPNNPKLQSALKNGVVLEADLYHAAKVSGGGGIVDLLKPGNNKRAGKSSFNENRLDAGEFLLMDRIGLKWGVSAGTDESDVKYITDYEDTATGKVIPNAILNADLIITAGTRPIIKLPVSKFIETAVNPTKQIAAVVLQQAKELNPSEVFSIKLEMPEGSVIPATENYFVKVNFGGLITQPK